MTGHSGWSGEGWACHSGTCGRTSNSKQGGLELLRQDTAASPFGLGGAGSLSLQPPQAIASNTTKGPVAAEGTVHSSTSAPHVAPVTQRLTEGVRLLAPGRGTSSAARVGKEGLLGGSLPVATCLEERSLPPTGNSLPTPVKVATLARLLSEISFPNADFVVSGFRFGFKLGFEGPQIPLSANNNLSVNRNIDAAAEKVSSEVSLGRIAGPFLDIPLSNFKCSPLSLREKSTPGKYRLLHNLSYPYDEQSVNFNIPMEASHLGYASVGDAIDSINHHCLLYLAKADIKDAYRLVPLHPSCYNLLGFRLKGLYYYDKCLPMGASSSCKIFESISTALQAILCSLYKVRFLVKMLDDFLFLGRSEGECRYGLDSFIHLCGLLSIPLAEEKTVLPARSATFLGVNIDTLSQRVSIPAEKVSSYAACLDSLLARDYCSLKEFKSTIGKLQFTCLVIPAGRAFLRRMHDATRGKTSPFSRVRLGPGIKEDLCMWKEFLSGFNGRGLLAYEDPLSSPDLHMYSDSSLSGYGATLGTRFIVGKFPPSWEGLDIQTLELFPILGLVAAFKLRLAGLNLIMHCDNLALVHILNAQTSKSSTVMTLLRPLVLLLLENKILFRAVHIPGVENSLADMLSRQLASPEVLRRHGMDESPTPLPQDIRPENWNPWSTP